MSHAVFDLALEMPPVTVNRVRVIDAGVLWVARCSLCGRRTRPFPLLSAAVKDAMRHGRKHATHMLSRTCTQPGRTSVHTFGREATATRTVQPLDAVHLSEPQDLTSRWAV